MLHEELMDLIMDHYENPRNFGQMDDPDIIQKGGNPGCGDIITIYLKVGKGKTIDHISFEGEGCIVSQATTSIISEMVRGMDFRKLKNFNSEEIKKILGKDLVIRRPRCSSLGVDTIKAAVREFEKNKKVVDLTEETI